MQLILDTQEKQRDPSRKKTPSVSPSHQLPYRNWPESLEASIPSSAHVFAVPDPVFLSPSLSQFQCVTHNWSSVSSPSYALLHKYPLVTSFMVRQIYMGSIYKFSINIY